ncbi:hypothetical protein B0H19DRAFT_1265159 [Mycena capillaripes]|nr:hypothetical protein B0H19DRAFT_1265159 [Mycena capillaripes]
MPPKANKSSTKGKGKTKLPKARFTAKAKTGSKRSGSPSESDSAAPSSSPKRQRTGAQRSAASGGPTASSPTSAGGSAAPADGSTPSQNGSGDGSETPKRPRNPWGIRSEEVPQEAKLTQKAFQRLIRAMCGLLTQHDVLPSAIEARTHYEKRFDKVDDIRAHMRDLISQSRTAVQAAHVQATKLIKDAKTIAGPIACDIPGIPASHLATVFTMVSKAGLKGYIPDVEGPVQSRYNELHRHLAVSAFQFLSSSFALYALNVDNHIAQDGDLLTDMFDNFVFGTLAQKTKMERRNPGSLGQSLENSVAFKPRTRLGATRFQTAKRLGLRKPVQRMAYVREAHSDDEHSPIQGRHTRDKPGRNSVVGKFFVAKLDVKSDEYRARNPVPGQKKPEVRKRDDPLLPASNISLVLPPDVPIDFFTPDFYNALTVKERARYANTGVAFPLEPYAFAPEHAAWKKMGKAEFMEKYGNNVLKRYNIPSQEEIDAQSDSEDDGEVGEEEELNLADTDSEMEVDEEVNGGEL